VVILLPNNVTVQPFVDNSDNAKHALFDARDNDTYYNSATELIVRDKLRQALGDDNKNGIIDNGEVPKSKGPYLLWSAGNDRFYGPKPSIPNPTQDDWDACDDVMSFR
jgi:hypothetical protein